MSKSAYLVPVLLALASCDVAIAKVLVSGLATGTSSPAVAYGGPNYLVAWQEGIGLRATRVSPSLGVLDPNGIDIFDEPPCCSTDVVSDGNDFFVTWQSVGPITKVYGRIVYGSTGLPGPLVLITSRVGSTPLDPSVAWAVGQQGPACYLVVWHDQDYIRGCRVGPDGTRLDPVPGFVVADVSPVRAGPRVTSNGEGFLVVWNDAGGIQFKVACVPVGTNGQPGGMSVIDLTSGAPDAVFDPTSGKYLVVWQESGSPLQGVQARHCDVAGVPEGDTFFLNRGTTSNGRPRVATSSVNRLAVWGHLQGGNYELRIRRAITGYGGYAVGTTDVVSPDQSSKVAPDVASSGSQYVIVWDEEGQGIYADTASPYQRHFYSDDGNATAYNQSRKIAKDPVSGWLHMTYECRDSVFYTYSTDGGSNWFPTEWVYGDVSIPFRARYPSIVCENQGPRPVWVSLLRVYEVPPGQACSMPVVLARESPGRWVVYGCAFGQWDGEWGPPVISACHEPNSTGNLGVYVAFPVHAPLEPPYFWWISFTRVFHPGGLDLFLKAAQSDLTPFANVSIATTPGDIVHLTWQNPITQRIYYLHRWYGYWPWVPAEVSLPPPSSDEPAYTPFVEAYGDSVFVVWRGHDEVSSEGEIWRRAKHVGQAPADYHFPLLYPPYPVFGTPGQPSACPQMSTKSVTLWQEKPWDRWDLWGRVGSMTDIVWATPESSVNPSVVAELPDQTSDPITVDAMWTEVLQEQPPVLCEVMHIRKYYSSGMDGRDVPAYYDCGVGDSIVSRYCQARDGGARWGDYSVDFGHQNLRYRLPFLNPDYNYRLRLVLYQMSRDTWQQRCVLDGRDVGTFTFRPMVPETVWVDVPRETYERDFEVAIDLSRVAGKYAAVAGLAVYQRWPYKRGFGGDGGQSARALPGRPILLESPTPSHFQISTVITYAVNQAASVSLRIFDVQGRMVRELATGPHGLGNYHVTWDATDASGRRVPAGAYLCRLQSGAASYVRKLVMVGR
jgi:hypothetical protein